MNTHKCDQHCQTCKEDKENKLKIALKAQENLRKPDSNTTKDKSIKEIYIESIIDSKKALDIALDVRKFEIELYWKRSTHFWTIIGATIAALGVVTGISFKDGKPNIEYINCLLIFIISTSGTIFSIAWQKVNEGSKFWQSNWEAQVDTLEDLVVGPIYKTVLSKFNNNKPANIYSPSRVNEILSGFFTALFSAIAITSMIGSIWKLWESWQANNTGTHASILIMCIFLCLFLCIFLYFIYRISNAETNTKINHEIDLSTRTTEIKANLTSDLSNKK